MATSQFLALACASTFLLAIVAPSLSQYSGEPITGTTNFVNKWHGGFIGVVDIPLDDNIDGWRMTITFPKNVFDFEICGAQVDEVENKRVYHLENSDWNAKHSAGSNLYFTFNAKTWKKIRGLIGKVRFWPTIDIVVPPTEMMTPPPIDGSSSGMGFDNGLDECINGAVNDVNLNHTCGSSFELISSDSSISVSEIQLNVDFMATDEVAVDITSTQVLAWFAIDQDFQMCLTTSDDTVYDIEASLSVVSTQKRILNIDITEELTDLRGRLKLRFRYPGSASNAVLFPYFEGTAQCPCERLEVVREEK